MNSLAHDSEPIQLHKSEIPWKPSWKRDSIFSDKDRLAGCVQAVLNKLTFQKFQILLSQISNLHIYNIEDLDLLIDVIYENAVSEPYFSVLYSSLCKELEQISVPALTGQHECFRTRLLKKCQQEFHKWCINTDSELNYQNGQSSCDMEEDVLRIKRRRLGIVNFIGELLKASLVINPIIHGCIEKLFSLQREDSLECVCQLLKKVGKLLEEDKAIDNNFCNESSMDTYFALMQSIIDKRSTSARIHFMLLDTVELRKNNWIPRRKEDTPKTIDEIHKEMEIEYNSNFSNRKGKSVLAKSS